MRKKLFSLLQFAIGIGLIVFLFSTLKDKSVLISALRDAAAHWEFLALAAITFFICLVLCTLRWKVLMEAQGLHLTFRRGFTLYFVGQFFNSFLFGSTGGDVVKAYYAAKETRHKKTEVVSTIFLDRVMGLIALIGLVVVVMLCRLKFFLSQPETRFALVFFGGVLVATAAGITLVFRQDLLERWAVTRRLRNETRVGAIIGRVYDAFQTALTHPVVLTKTLLLSVMNHLLFVLTSAFLGAALKLKLSYIEYLSTMPIINAIAAIPITPGGLGSREATSTIFLATVGVAPESGRAIMLSLLSYSIVLLWSLVGGVVYFVYAARMGRAPEELQAAE